MIDFQIIRPQEIREHWPWLRTGVEKMLSRRVIRGLIAEDVYGDFKSGNYGIYAVVVDGEREGWMAVRLTQDTDGPALFIQGLWWYGFKKREREMYDRLDAFARAFNAKRIRYEAHREGWLRQDYAKPVRRVYERELL